ncbi:uncharacterized protein BJ171DRAFT_493979 [Polychytrium aggregatum]|uniref:uncharacterized protein n=1 Tax=Polychytrium aggregatum TaxID=110093 RepID=UPI0022FF0E4D|nr:uncharacterized protein BJ171DRAFT_493979 [Polychytrium aggregatum]KAI9207241.1 hypothetical protein BJ171DRAFT_493979 [Polychytrium aggregatum]
MALLCLHPGFTLLTSCVILSAYRVSISCLFAFRCRLRARLPTFAWTKTVCHLKEHRRTPLSEPSDLLSRPRRRALLQPLGPDSPRPNRPVSRQGQALEPVWFRLWLRQPRPPDPTTKCYPVCASQKSPCSKSDAAAAGSRPSCRSARR